jgi:hypothetical protein
MKPNIAEILREVRDFADNLPDGAQLVVPKDVVILFCDEVERQTKEIEILQQLLKRSLPYIETEVEQHGYGFFPGGDPTAFTPDEQMNRPQEIENWKEACKRWNDGNRYGEPSSHMPIVRGEEVIGHATVAKLGMGSYIYVDEEAKALVDAIGEALRRDTQQ